MLLEMRGQPQASPSAAQNGCCGRPQSPHRGHVAPISRLISEFSQARIPLCYGAIPSFERRSTSGLGERTFDAISGWRGPDSPPWPASMDSVLRFYAALWGAYGLLALRCARNIDKQDGQVPWLAAMFFAGGVGRAMSCFPVGAPHPFLLALMAIELTLPVALAGLWLAQRRAPSQSHS